MRLDRSENEFVKSVKLLRSRSLKPSQWFEIIAAEKHHCPTKSMCEWAGVSESGYWAWARRKPSQTGERQEYLGKEIKQVFDASNQIYGYRKVAAQPRVEGMEVCDGTVRTTISESGLETCHPAPWRAVTESDGSRPSDDLINRDFTAARPGVRLVGDITQIDTWEGPLSPATVIDLFNREVVGYEMDDN